jgi:hypothetical protein
MIIYIYIIYRTKIVLNLVNYFGENYYDYDYDYDYDHYDYDYDYDYGYDNDNYGKKER